MPTTAMVQWYLMGATKVLFTMVTTLVSFTIWNLTQVNSIIYGTIRDHATSNLNDSNHTSMR